MLASITRFIVTLTNLNLTGLYMRHEDIAVLGQLFAYVI